MNERVKTVKSLEVPGPSVVQPQVLCKCQERKVFAVEHCLACRPEAQNHDLIFWSTGLCQHKQPSAGHEPFATGFEREFIEPLPGLFTVHSILATTQCCHNCSVGTNSV